jgi:hypothetical protein
LVIGPSERIVSLALPGAYVEPPIAGVVLVVVLVRVVRLEGVKVPTRVSRICPLNNFFPPCRCCNPSAAQRAMHGALFSPTHPNVPCPERIVARPATQRLLPPPDSRAFYVSASET